MLFTLSFKFCKYCNKPFIPTHNRQVHCDEKCRNKYKYLGKTQKRFEDRQKEEIIKFIDPHGNFIQCKRRKLKQLGSMKADLGPHKDSNFDKEQELIKNQLKYLGLKCYAK